MPPTSSGAGNPRRPAVQPKPQTRPGVMRPQVEVLQPTPIQPQKPAWQLLAERGMQGTGSAAGNRAAAAGLPGGGGPPQIASFPMPPAGRQMRPGQSMDVQSGGGFIGEPMPLGQGAAAPGAGGIDAAIQGLRMQLGQKPGGGLEGRPGPGAFGPGQVAIGGVPLTTQGQASGSPFTPAVLQNFQANTRGMSPQQIQEMVMSSGGPNPQQPQPMIPPGLVGRFRGMSQPPSMDGINKPGLGYPGMGPGAPPLTPTLSGELMPPPDDAMAGGPQPPNPYVNILRQRLMQGMGGGMGNAPTATQFGNPAAVAAAMGRFAY
jgi:hypothetical protein